MNAAGRSARDALIERRHRAGEASAAIARDLKLHPTRVRTILVARGAAAPEPSGTSEGIWAEPPDRRRRAIYERQRAGARAALALMEGSST